jgi:hypothetical protein
MTQPSRCSSPIQYTTRTRNPRSRGRSHDGDSSRVRAEGRRARVRVTHCRQGQAPALAGSGCQTDSVGYRIGPEGWPFKFNLIFNCRQWRRNWRFGSVCPRRRRACHSSRAAEWLAGGPGSPGHGASCPARCQVRATAAATAGQRVILETVTVAVRGTMQHPGRAPLAVYSVTNCQVTMALLASRGGPLARHCGRGDRWDSCSLATGPGRALTVTGRAAET